MRPSLVLRRPVASRPAQDEGLLCQPQHVRRPSVLTRQSRRRCPRNGGGGGNRETTAPKPAVGCIEAHGRNAPLVDVARSGISLSLNAPYAARSVANCPCSGLISQCDESYWIRAAAHAPVKSALEEALPDSKSRLAYQMLDGSKSMDQVRVACKMSPNALLALATRCAALGLMEVNQDKKRVRLFDLSDFDLVSPSELPKSGTKE